MLLTSGWTLFSDEVKVLFKLAEPVDPSQHKAASNSGSLADRRLRCADIAQFEPNPEDVADCALSASSVPSGAYPRHALKVACEMRLIEVAKVLRQPGKGRFRVELDSGERILKAEAPN